MRTISHRQGTKCEKRVTLFPSTAVLKKLFCRYQKQKKNYSLPTPFRSICLNLAAVSCSTGLPKLGMKLQWIESIMDKKGFKIKSDKRN